MRTWGGIRQYLPRMPDGIKQALTHVDNQLHEVSASIQRLGDNSKPRSRTVAVADIPPSPTSIVITMKVAPIHALNTNLPLIGDDKSILTAGVWKIHGYVESDVTTANPDIFNLQLYLNSPFNNDTSGVNNPRVFTGFVDSQDYSPPKINLPAIDFSVQSNGIEPIYLQPYNNSASIVSTTGTVHLVATKVV